MAKNSWNDYSATAASNSDVGNVNTSETMNPSDVNDAIRELMSHTADVVAGTVALSSIDINGGSVTGITDLAVADGGTGASTLTANGVLFGNGTSAVGATAVGSSGQVLTSNGSGSAPTFQAAATTYTHPNHSGEVTSTGDGATVIASNVVDEDNLKVSNSPTNGYLLTARSGNTGGMTWEAAAGGGGVNWEVVDSGNSLSSGTYIDISSYKHVKARFYSDATPNTIHGPKLSTSGSSNSGVSTSKGYYYRVYPNGAASAPFHSTYAGSWSPNTSSLYYGGSAPEQSVKLWELDLIGLDQTKVGIIARTQATTGGQMILSWSGRTSSGSSSWYLYIADDLDNYLVLGAS